MPKGLTARQQLFVDAFDGNATAAATHAGCSAKSAAVTGSKWLRNPKVAAAIRERQAKSAKPLIASREARQKFWTEVMTSVAYEPRDRLKASELLGKSEADFTEKVQHSGGMSIGIVDPYAVKRDG